MAVDVYSVTNAMVLSRLPIDSSNIGAATTPLGTNDIDAFIEDGAAQMTAILQGHGLTTTLSDDNMTAQVQAAIIHFGVWKCLEKLPNVPRDRINAAEKAWLDDLTRYSARNEFLVTQADDKTESNVSTSTSKKAASFVGLNYEF